MQTMIRFVFIVFLLLLAASVGLAQDEPDIPDPDVPIFDLSGVQVEPDQEPESPDPQVPQFQIPPLAAQSSTFARVIVGLNLPRYQPETRLEGALAVQDQRMAIEAAQDQVFRDVANTGAYVEEAARFRTIPYMTLEVDAVGLAALQNHPYVTSIQPDEMEFALATDADLTYAVINADDAVAAGFDGTDQVVVVIDQGTIFTHPAFAQTDVKDEACFTSNVTDSNTGESVTASTCPGGAETAIGPGASRPSNVTALSNHTHGEHVTGTIAGNDGVSGGFRGVAPDASIISINTFSRVTSGSSAGQTTSWITDSTRALEWIYENRNVYNIVAVNMSLGGGRFFDEATCAAQDAARGAIIRQLYEAGIVVIAASGNNGYVDSMSRPACHPEAISVGSTTVVGTSGAKCTAPSSTDSVSLFSNSASFLDLLAPGQCVYSSAFTDNSSFIYEGWQGTSMATPHVSGAWAILSEAYPNAAPADLLAALKDTGKPVVDGGNNLTFPRIDVFAAMGMSPGTPEILAPKDRNAGTTPTFHWKGTTYALNYRLRILDGATVVLDQVITTCRTLQCSLTLTNPLPLSNNYTWTVAAINPRGTEGTATAAQAFIVANAPVVADDFYTTPVGQTLTVSAANGVLQNDSDPGGTPQALTVTDPGNGTLTFSSDGAFTYTPNPSFVGDDTFTYKLTSSADVATVTITIPKPVKTNFSGMDLIAPSGTLTVSTGHPTYVWTEVVDATEYGIYVALKNNLFAANFYGIIPASTFCQNNVCSVDLIDPALTPILGAGWLASNGTYSVFLNPFPDNASTWIAFDNAFTLDVAAPKALTPTGVDDTVGSLRPTFNWALDSDAASTAFFQLYVAPTDNITASVFGTALTHWVSREDACGSWTGNTCSYRLEVDLQDKTHYQAYMNSWGPGGFSTGGNVPGVDGWVNFEFNMGGAIPNLPSNIQVNSSNPPTITWDDDPLATSFSIWVGVITDPNTWIFLEEASKSGSAISCNGTTCSHTVSQTLASGAYNIYMQAQGANGTSRGGIGGLNLGWAEGPDFNIP